MRKNDQEISIIKENILKNNKDLLEWINIKRTGMKYIINIEPKVEKNKIDQEDYCNVISTKDAIITKIITSNGVELKDINDSVKKGEIIISGDIKFNEETKNKTCATGTVYGTTWYTINISIPKNYSSYEKLNKKRYNLVIKHNTKKNKIFRPRLEKYITEDKKILNIFGFELYFSKEIEVKEMTKEYQSDELEEKVNELVTEKMNSILKGDYKIIDRKVLKKVDNNSTIDIDMFIVAEEQISSLSYTIPNEDIANE